MRFYDMSIAIDKLQSKFFLHVAAVFLLCGIAPPVARAQPVDPGGGTMSATLARDELGLQLRFNPDAHSRFGFSLHADAEYVDVRSFLELGADSSDYSRMTIGPGSASGLLRFLFHPTSETAMTMGSPVAIDRSMEASKAVLGLGTENVRAFAIAEGRESLWKVYIPSLEADGVETARSIKASAVGFALTGSVGAVDWAALADTSYRAPGSEDEGWTVETRPDVGGGLCHAAFAVRRTGPSSSSLAAFAASAGRLEGSGFAARLQSTSKVGPLSLSLSMSGASPFFRPPFGGQADAFFRAHGELVYNQTRKIKITYECDEVAEGEGLVSAPKWISSQSCTVSTYLGGGRKLRVSGSLGGSAEPLISALFSRQSAMPALPGGSDHGSARSTFEVTLRFDKEGAHRPLPEFGIGISRTYGRRLPSFKIDAKLGYPSGADPEKPPTARGSLEITFPAAEGRLVYVKAALPDSGIKLSPYSHYEEAIGCLEISFGFRAAFHQTPSLNK